MSYVRLVLMGFLLLATGLAFAATSERKLGFNQTDLMMLPIGVPLDHLKVRGTPLGLVYGQGHPFTQPQQAAYRKLKHQAMRQKNYRIQWALMQLDDEHIITKSRSAERNFYGASVSKIYVGAAILHKYGGTLPAAQLQQLADMIVVSSNTAWGALQSLAGSGSNAKGQQYIQDFTENLGYKKTRSFRGWMGPFHGNEINAIDLVKFLGDTYHNRYQGAETLWKIMHATRTGDRKARHFLPKTLMVGGKTGSYRGPMVDPLTRKLYTAAVHHHAIVFRHTGKQYGLVVLTDLSSDQEVALITKGIVMDYLDQPDLRSTAANP